MPRCPHCGAFLTTNLRADHTFVQDKGWYRAKERYDLFCHRWDGAHILYLELGVGYNTPGVIKYPFWHSADRNHNSVYAIINQGQADVPKELKKRSIRIDNDLHRTVLDLIHS